MVLTREPGDIFRELLLHSSDVVPAAELFLFMADRAQHTETTIRPALLRGRVVLCDRYADSTVAYQGYGRGMDLKLIHTLNRAATSGLVPDLTVLLDVPPEIALMRKASGDRFEGEGLEFLGRVREGYLEMARAEPGRFLVVDGRGPEEEIAESVWESVSARLKLAKPKMG